MQLGERIKSVRQAKGMTQTQVAGTHITRNMLSQIENGSASPSVKTLEYLAETLGVTVGYLLSEEDNGKLVAARKKLRSGDFSGALKATTDADGDEGNLLLSRIYQALANECLAVGELTEAAEYARKSLGHNGKTVYRTKETEAEMLWILAYSEMNEKDAEASAEKYRKTYDDWGWEAKNHLLRAGLYLKANQDQAAEREIWMITSLPDKDKIQYLLLRSDLAIRQEKYSNAISYLKQIDEQEISSKKMRMELYRLLEIAYRETQDYKAAYEYAAKQHEK